MNTKIFAKRLRLARESMGYSQKHLGIRVGLSDKSISMYEKGTVYPPVSNLLKIAKELKKDISYFLEE
ncbi:MAG: helix-turn-helix transcriptional regulator [Candidatus Dojkabacteria bacterium]|nr:helix-turn-helix transcriptional regulator [Candidatus Dojkabacteria bacterium]MDD4561175.1 helix-turn-helix transcriptional regulator [Candidatus Dojkabacteria bacterium]NLB11999.1 helix-turn-helix transcriptional regulator [Candidatus Dojkabacteria bacterium]